MTQVIDSSSETDRILSFLEMLLVSKRISIRELERRMQVSYGALWRVFTGKIALKLQTVLDVLEEIDVPRKTFFSAVFSVDEASSPSAEELLTRVQALSLPEPAPPPAFSQTEIKRMIAEVLGERQVPPTPRPHQDESASSSTRSRRRDAKPPTAKAKTTS
jgi:transcriptional regulator with XRE-family HTH domain